MNAYNIFDENHYDTILYHAVAKDEDQVKELANEKGIDLEGLEIELERKNVKDQLKGHQSLYRRCISLLIM